MICPAKEILKFGFDEIMKYKTCRGFRHLPGIYQANGVETEQLKDAQLHPENYRDLVIRMWGVSAHFVDMPRDVQDEFIARLA